MPLNQSCLLHHQALTLKPFTFGSQAPCCMQAAAGIAPSQSKCSLPNPQQVALILAWRHTPGTASPSSACCAAPHPASRRSLLRNPAPLLRNPARTSAAFQDLVQHPIAYGAVCVCQASASLTLTPVPHCSAAECHCCAHRHVCCLCRLLFSCCRTCASGSTSP